MFQPRSSLISMLSAPAQLNRAQQRRPGPEATVCIYTCTCRPEHSALPCTYTCMEMLNWKPSTDSLICLNYLPEHNNAHVHTMYTCVHTQCTYTCVHTQCTYTCVHTCTQCTHLQTQMCKHHCVKNNVCCIYLDPACPVLISQAMISEAENVLGNGRNLQL